MSEKHPFWMTMKCYAFVESNRLDEVKDILVHLKPTTQTDPVVVKLLVLALVKTGRFAECTKMLENC